jgi:putative membrane protein
MRFRLSRLAINGAVPGLLSLLAAWPAQAQFGNPGFMTPDSAAPRPALSIPNPSDRLFVLLLGQGGLAEVELARLADGKARDGRVKRFARHMHDDHSQANQRLASAARDASLAVPAGPAPDQREQRDRLQALADGAEFELAYLRNQLVEHQKTVQLLAWEINAGQIPPLQRFAAATLPVVLEHLAMVQQLLGELSGAATRDLPQERRPDH